MKLELSLNTQAILLLTAPLIIKAGTSISSDLLSPKEYNTFAFHLRKLQRQPSDLLLSDSIEILDKCRTIVAKERLQRLLKRGFLLTQAVERWQTRAIWVISRADAEYPNRLKSLLREDAPAILYGCGNIDLLDTGGLAVVGSRHAEDALVDYTVSIGKLSAKAGSKVISGGAKGIDQAAMRGALEAGGSVCGILADSLEKAAMKRENRDSLLDGQLVLISPYDPNAGFNVGHAMQRNKLIYALADASLVVSSDFNKGGTWSGAVEQLDKFKFTPVFVRSTGRKSVGLDALYKKGALLWPNPEHVDSFEKIFDKQGTEIIKLQQASFQFVELPTDTEVIKPPEYDTTLIRDKNISLENTPTVKREVETNLSVHREELIDTNAVLTNETPAEQLFSIIRELIQQVLSVPMNDTEVAEILNISKSQVRIWLKRLVDEGCIEKRTKPITYISKKSCCYELFNSQI